MKDLFQSLIAAVVAKQKLTALTLLLQIAIKLSTGEELKAEMLNELTDTEKELMMAASLTGFTSLLD